jgi:acylphosphatase
MWALKTKLGLQIEDSHRDAYLTAAKNRAAELIAKGFVSMQERGKVEIDNRALADAVNTLVRAVPDAVKQFNIKESDIERTITAMVPQIPETAVVEGKVVAAPPANGVLAPKAERR